MSEECLLKSKKNVMSQVSSGCDIPANAAEGFGSFLRAESSRDFLLNLHHADVSFRSIVIEGNRKVVSKRERLFFPQPQSLQQILRRSSFGSSFFRRSLGDQKGVC